MMDDGKIVRRAFLSGSLGILGSQVLPRRAAARPEDVVYAIRQDFGPIDHLANAGITLDMPQHTDAGTSVPLTVRVASPMTPQDHPEQVRLYGSVNPRPRIATVYFTPQCGRAEFSTRVRLDGAQTITAIAQSVTGAYMRADRRVGVSFGACAAAGNSDGMPEDWAPSIRVRVPDTAHQGEIVEVRSIITHPMETGLRLNARNQYVPLRIIETFTCILNGATAFRARLEPAISTNPYLAFPLRIDADSDLAFEWLDTTGAVYRHDARIALA